MTTSVKANEVDIEAVHALLDDGELVNPLVSDLLGEVERFRAEATQRASKSAHARESARATLTKLETLVNQIIEERDEALAEVAHLRQANAGLKEQLDDLTSDYDRLDTRIEVITECFLQEGITAQGLDQLEVELSDRLSCMRKGLQAINSATARLDDVGIIITRSRGVAVSGLAWEDLPDLYSDSPRVREAYDAFDAMILEELEKAQSIRALDPPS